MKNKYRLEANTDHWQITNMKTGKAAARIFFVKGESQTDLKQRATKYYNRYYKRYEL